MLPSIFKRILIMLCMCLSALPLDAQTVQIGDGITPNTAICLNTSTGAAIVAQVQGGVVDCSALPKNPGEALSIIVSGSASTGTGGTPPPPPPPPPSQ